LILKGFEPEQSETAFLRQRLLEEQADARRAHQARLEAETRCHAAERERDVYRLLAHRWQTRLQDLLRQRGGSASVASDRDNTVVERQEEREAALDSILHERGRRAIVIGTVLRRFQSEDDDDDDEEIEDSEMDEDDDEVQAEVAARGSNDTFDDDESSHDDSARRTYRADSVTMEDADDGDLAMAASPTTAKAIVSRPQVRTVSISSDDL
jgi:hypothetical protein